MTPMITITEMIMILS